MAGSLARSVFMPVVNIRVMGVSVFLAIMPVWMRMRFAPRIVRLMLMAGGARRARGGVRVLLPHAHASVDGAP